MDNAKFLKFIHDYTGPKLAFVVTGGGVDIHRIAQTAGASKILHSIYAPYAREESVKFISDYLSESDGKAFDEKAVCAKSAHLLCKAGLERWSTCRVVACTAAITTDRYRRGLNQAYVAIGEPSSKKITEYHLSLSKLEEYEHGVESALLKRKQDDCEIADFLMRLVLAE